MVAEIAAGFVLVVVKEMVPIPLAPNPMAGLVFVQVYTVPTILPVKTILPVLMPVQYILLVTELATGMPVTETVIALLGPSQPAAVS